MMVSSIYFKTSNLNGTVVKKLCKDKDKISIANCQI